MYMCLLASHVVEGRRTYLFKSYILFLKWDYIMAFHWWHCLSVGKSKLATLKAFCDSAYSPAITECLRLGSVFGMEVYYQFTC